MKLTSFEISKKLKEAGFEAQSSFFWCRLDKDLIRIHISQSYSVPESFDKIKAYDLETILDALPARIEKNEKMYDLLLHHNILGYYATSLKLDYDNIQLDDYIFELYDYDKSLADTAGRLLIELFEAGIINFKK
jgi:hypothetical protein